MARKATIIGAESDIWDDRWDVREYRTTDHGFAVVLGWPAAQPRGRDGSGGPKVIITAQLASHMEAHRRIPLALHLPIGATAIKRVRRLLGHHRQIDAAAWWDERVTDLSDLTIGAFANRHMVSVGAASTARSALLGPKLRPAGWWRAPDIAAIILSNRPRAEKADLLGLSAGAVGRLRWVLKSDARRSKDDTPDLAEALALIEKGASTTGVVLYTGVGRGRLLRALERQSLPHPPRTSATISAAVARVLGGTSVKDAAAAEGVTRVGVYLALRRAGKPLPNGPRNSSEIRDAVALVQSGASVADAAARAGVTTQAVYYALRRLGLSAPGGQRSKATAAMMARAIAAVHLGASIDAAAADAGVSVSGLYRALKRSASTPTPPVGTRP
jgi:transposase